MKTASAGISFGQMITSFNADVQEVAQQLRVLIDDVYPETVEVVWEKQRIAGFGVGPKKMSEHFCYIAPQTKHVNLGFYYGTALPDPAGLLEGTGKNMRHVKVYELTATLEPSLRNLLIASVAERKVALNL